MTLYLNELGSIVPQPMRKKTDKLTILRLASAHMRSLRESHQQVSNDNTQPLTEQELKFLFSEVYLLFFFVAHSMSPHFVDLLRLPTDFCLSLNSITVKLYTFLIQLNKSYHIQRFVSFVFLSKFN